MNINKNLLLGSVVLLMVSACASTDPTRVEDDFGKSVQQMINAQILDPVAAQYPPSDAPSGLDGMTAEEVLKTYREDVADPKDVRKAFDLDVQ